MRVGANVNDNQIMLWANKVEMDEVRNLLVKLGEIPAEGSKPSNLRVIDASRQPETLEYLKKLQERWNRVSPNPLILPDADEFKEKTPPAQKKTDAPAAAPTVDAVTFANDPSSIRLTSAQVTTDPTTDPKPTEPTDPKPTEPKPVAPAAQPAEQPAVASEPAQDDQQRAVKAAGTADDTANERTNPPRSQRNIGQTNVEDVAPIEIMIDEAGNLVLRSNDTEALDRLEELMQVNKPPKKPYDLFYVKYTRASWVVFNLEDYFKNDDGNKDSSRDDMMSWIFGIPPEKKKSTPDRQLGRKKPLRFLADNDTNTIIVQGATDADRATIQELIDLWDVAEPINDSSVRYTKIIKIKYSQAEVISEVVKEAYRDYLSASDKAFHKTRAIAAAATTKANATAMGKWFPLEQAVFSLKGKLSIGVDSVTNSIVVFAQGKNLLEVVTKMIEELDDSARPQGSVEILDMSASVDASKVSKALRAIMSKNGNNKNNKNQPNMPNGQGQRQNGQGNPGINVNGPDE